MLDDVLPFLRCPICHNELTRATAALRCQDGHSFDIARQGYVSLLPAGRARAAGDTAAMVAARREFLGAGHFAGLAQAVAKLAAGLAASRAASQIAGQARSAPSDQPRHCVLDVGAGTGYYLAAVLDQLPGHAGIAADVSKFALRAAARAHPLATAVGCDAWRPLPVANGAADLVLNIFAPRDGAELRRVTGQAGHLIVVTPQPDHLGELAGPLGLISVDPRKAERLAGTLGGHFDVVAEHAHRATLALDHKGVAALTAMGPSAGHIGADELAARVKGLPPVSQVTLAATLSVFRPAPMCQPAEVPL